MRDTDIIANLQARLGMPGGRHLYGVLGTYSALETFAARLAQAKDANGKNFPTPLSVNGGILDAIPDAEFRELAEKEAKLPEPVRAHVGQAFERFLRRELAAHGLIVLWRLELLFAYSIEMTALRTLATDEARVILLLPGRRDGERVVMFSDADAGGYTLPTSLIANDHLWEVT